MKEVTLKAIGLTAGVLSGLGCFAALIKVFGEHHFGMAVGAFLVGSGVNHFTQKLMINQFMAKAIQDD